MSDEAGTMFALPRDRMRRPARAVWGRVTDQSVRPLRWDREMRDRKSGLEDLDNQYMWDTNMGRRDHAGNRASMCSRRDTTMAI
jgi:hypothetical protein